MNHTALANAVRTALVAAGAFLLTLSSARAQTNRVMPSGEILPNVVATERFMCRVAAGQIMVTCPRPYNNRSQDSPGLERIGLRPSEDGAIVDYELRNSDEHFIFEVRGQESLRLRREVGAPATGKVVELLQKQGGRLTFTVGSAGQTKVYEAPGFWHLLIAERDLCQQSLFPLLMRIRKEWGLDEKLDTIEEELLRLASGSGSVDRQRWTALVRQLADDRFGRREAAERELRAAGAAARGFLDQLDFNRLEAEQQARIRRILLDAPVEPSDDSPALVASALLDVPSVWLGLLSRAQPATRRQAAAQLSKLLAAPIQFDAEAEPAVRQRQIDAIRANVAGAAPRR
jgi:hypothetical protein